MVGCPVNSRTSTPKSVHALAHSGESRLLVCPWRGGFSEGGRHACLDDSVCAGTLLLLITRCRVSFLGQKIKINNNAERRVSCRVINRHCANLVHSFYSKNGKRGDATRQRALPASAAGKGHNYVPYRLRWSGNTNCFEMRAHGTCTATISLGLHGRRSSTAQRNQSSSSVSTLSVACC